MKKQILMSWSGGKDSAFALHELMKSGEYEVSALLTTVTEDYDRISMHGVRRTLLEKQAQSIGLPLEVVTIPKSCTNQTYEDAMRAMLERQKAAGVEAVAFGDIFLEDLKQYRIDKLAQVDMGAVFPIWKRYTTELAHEFIDSGFKTVLTCVDSQHLDGKFVGREYDKQLLAELPESVDPCGENGEFHSFAYAGPVFTQPIKFERGEVVLRDERFWYCDLV